MEQLLYYILYFAVYMKTVVMLNALSFFHKIKDIQLNDFSLGIFL